MIKKLLIVAAGMVVGFATLYLAGLVALQITPFGRMARDLSPMTQQSDGQERDRGSAKYADALVRTRQMSAIADFVLYPLSVLVAGLFVGYCAKKHSWQLGVVSSLPIIIFAGTSNIVAGEVIRALGLAAAYVLIGALAAKMASHKAISMHFRQGRVAHS